VTSFTTSSCNRFPVSSTSPIHDSHAPFQSKLFQVQRASVIPNISTVFKAYPLYIGPAFRRLCEAESRGHCDRAARVNAERGTSMKKPWINPRRCTLQGNIILGSVRLKAIRRYSFSYERKAQWGCCQACGGMCVSGGRHRRSPHCVRPALPSVP